MALESKITSVEECHLKWFLFVDLALRSDCKLVKFVSMSRMMLLSVLVDGGARLAVGS